MAAEAVAQDLERVWDDIRDGIRTAYAFREMTSETYMTLYSRVYSFCSRGGDGARPINNRERGNGAGNGNNDEFHRNNRNRTLYTRIRELLKSQLGEVVQGAEDKNGEGLITFYLEQWERLTFCMKVVNGFCAYLNQHWIHEQHNEGQTTICEIYPLAMRIWSETVFNTLRTPMTAFILQNILLDRQGKQVDSGMIKRMTDAIASLGESCLELSPYVAVPAAQPLIVDNNALGIYRDSFEDPFISATEHFYAHEAAEFLQSEDGSVQEYMKKVEQRLSEEMNRAESYLHPSTLFRLMESCDKVLILQQLPLFVEEFPKLLKANETDGLKRMYSLVSRIPDSFGGMESEFQNYIELTGRRALEDNLEQVKKSPMEYVKALLNVHQKFQEVALGPFQKDPGFVAALDQGCRSFVNRNCLTSDPSDPNASRRSPINLAKYLDQLLRKTGKVDSEEDLDDRLKQAIIIFKYIDDKDVFKQYYTMMLAKRLIDELSASDEDESSMVLKLKVECGYEYTVKLQKMFQDIVTSRDYNGDFRDYLERHSLKLGLNFTAKVLQAGSWPYTPDAINHAFIPPRVLESCVNHYKIFYEQKTQGRALNWLHKKSIGEVESYKDVFGGTPYTFILPTYGVAILLQYSSRDSSTLQELADATTLDLQTVTSLVRVLLKANLLISLEIADDLTATSNIALNLGYRSKKRKVNLTTPTAADVKLDDERNRASVEKGRSAEVKAAIVRVMKARKTLNLQLLISEVVEQLKNRFPPTVTLIRKCVQDLIKDEFLRPSEEDNSNLQYIS